MEKGPSEVQIPPSSTRGSHGIQQCKDTFSIIKSNMTTPETIGSTPARPEHLAQMKQKKKDIKNKFMKMIEEMNGKFL